MCEVPYPTEKTSRGTLLNPDERVRDDSTRREIETDLSRDR